MAMVRTALVVSVHPLDHDKRLLACLQGDHHSSETSLFFVNEKEASYRHARTQELASSLSRFESRMPHEPVAFVWGESKSSPYYTRSGTKKK